MPTSRDRVVPLLLLTAMALVLFASPAGAEENPPPNSVSAYGTAVDHGPPDGFAPNDPFVALAAHPSGDGYWVTAPDGGVFTFGAASFHGSAGGIELNQPVVGMAATASGGGYWLAAADGGIFTYGDAAFHGSMGGVALNEPIVGIASHPEGDGYWLVASDGGIFTFGDAGFHGSAGSIDLDAPIVGMTPTASGGGYWLVAADGGVFTYGDAAFHGSRGDKPVEVPFTGMAASPSGEGYWLVAADGQVVPFGVTDHGNAAADDQTPQARTVGITAHGDDGYWLVHGPPGALGVEDRGPAVTALQSRLAELGYWVGPIDGVYGKLTTQAVYAFQKVTGLPVDGEADRATREALFRAERPRPAGGAGDRIEVDKSRQVLFVVRDGAVLWAFNTSTGTEEPYTYEGEEYLADTPPGRWTITREIDGYRTSNLGRLYRPKYFHPDGIAVHGYTSVPPYPASHGCVRLTNSAMDFLWESGLAPIGHEVWVYGTTPDV